MKLDVYNLEGKKTTSKVEIKPTLSEVKVSHELIRQAVLTELSNRRVSSAHTKTRAEVRGGGAKPWRQKGTGRARAGSVRSPLWRGGGVTFGPRKEKSYKKKMPQKMKVKAILGVLSSQFKENKVIVVSNFKIEKLKTKELVRMLSRFRISGNILILLAKKDEVLARACRNLPSVKLRLASALNILDLISADFIILTKEGIKVIEETYTDKLKVKSEKSKVKT